MIVPRPAIRSSSRALNGLCAAVLSLSCCWLISTPALAGVANAGLLGASSSNPLAGMTWGNYAGPLDEVFPAYRAARGLQRRLLGLVALRPRVRWFGSWYPDEAAETVARQYIASVTSGRTDVLSQIAVFRLEPWEQAACRRLVSAQEQASYRRWIDAFATGIGSSRVALVLQPDLPFALCVPRRSRLPLALVAYAAKRFGALAHTTVYIDAGAADWEKAGQAASLLGQAGVRYARGFALDATHYDSTEHEIFFGGRIARALAAAHVVNRHFIVNTAENGRPFTHQQYQGRGGSSYDNATVCGNREVGHCVTLGIPPTTKVADRRWGLSSRARVIAARLVDAYLWLGRPWLDNQADPFDLQRSLALARSTPF